MYVIKPKIAKMIRYFLPLLLLTAAVSMTACAEQKHYKSTVEIITIDTKDGEDVRIPQCSCQMGNRQGPAGCGKSEAVGAVVTY